MIANSWRLRPTCGNAVLWWRPWKWAREPVLHPGKTFLLTRETLAVMMISGKRQAKYLPVGAILTVRPTYQSNDTSVEVDWEGQIVTMFAADLEARGRHIQAQSASLKKRALTSD